MVLLIKVALFRKINKKYVNRTLILLKILRNLPTHVWKWEKKNSFEITLRIAFFGVDVHVRVTIFAHEKVSLDSACLVSDFGTFWAPFPLWTPHRTVADATLLRVRCESWLSSSNRIGFCSLGWTCLSKCLRNFKKSSAFIQLDLLAQPIELEPSAGNVVAFLLGEKWKMVEWLDH